MERRLRRKGSPPWHAGSHYRSQERRERIVRSRIGKRERICLGVHGKNKRKDRTNKPLDAVQNISDAFGGILSKMTGGIGYTGSAFLQMGTKWKLQLIDFSNKEGGV